MNLPKDIPDLERQVNLQGVLAVAVISGCPFATAKKKVNRHKRMAKG
jgi:hypothetical protein